MAIDPNNPDRALVIPLLSEMDRVTFGRNVRVYETTDRGASWKALEEGLPQGGAYLTPLRQAFCTDGQDPHGLFFGFTSGDVFGSADGGLSWSKRRATLPPVHSVRMGRIGARRQAKGPVAPPYSRLDPR